MTAVIMGSIIMAKLHHDSEQIIHTLLWVVVAVGVTIYEVMT